MKRKTKSLIILTAVLFVIIVAGMIITFFMQSGEIKKKEAKLNTLRTSYASIQVLQSQLDAMEQKVTAVDSLLFSGTHAIPRNRIESDFYAFVDNYSRDYSLYTYTNTEYAGMGSEEGFNYYVYKVSGAGAFDNVYKLIYAIEHGKELKKIQKADVTSTSIVDNKGVPRYLTKFALEVKVYYSSSDQYSAAKFTENNLYTTEQYDAFYPLVRSEIRPNLANLPDIQESTLLSLVPQGAFITDKTGNTLLMKKGDAVYLGYLSEIDYENETVTFILNKGGIIEYLTLSMGKANKKKG